MFLDFHSLHRFLTLRKQISYENVCLKRYVNLKLKINSIYKQLIDQARPDDLHYLCNSSLLLPSWFIQRHFNKNLSNSQFFYLFFNNAKTRNVRWRKMDLIVRHVSYFKFAARAIKPHFHATFVFFFFLESEYCLRYGKTGNTKLATCFASLLQNRLNSDVARYIYHPHKTCHATDRIRLLTGLNMGNKTSCTFFCCPFFRTFSALRAAKP